MKVPNRDNNCKYSINLKIFKLQPPTTINGSTTAGNGDKKSSSLLVPMPPMQPTMQRKRNSWRNAWKLANSNNNNKIRNSIKNNTNLNANNNSNCCNVKNSLEDDETNIEIVPKATRDIMPSLKEQFKKNDTNNNTINNHQTPLDDEHILCKFIENLIFFLSILYCIQTGIFINSIFVYL